MKYLMCTIFLMISLTAVQSNEKVDMMKLLMENLEKCGTDLKVDVKFITEVKDNIDFKKLKDPEYKCLTKCLLEKFESLDAQGDFQLEKAKELMPDLNSFAEIIMMECVDKYKESDLCERYKNVQGCVFEKMQVQ